MADQQFEDLRAVVAERLLTRVEHHSGIGTALSAAQARSPQAATAAAVDAMVASSSIPLASRPLAAEATATMLAEGFDELPARMADWRARGANLHREAELYGNTLGDRTMSAIRSFEQQPPDPAGAQPDRGQEAAANHRTDGAIPPLRVVRTSATTAHRSEATPRAGGSAGDAHRDAPGR
ncbi:hypothetical protein [Kribbella sp. NPDC004536]|uniref:hypothetical protein n=1 Tax=Kribbella sp. NPDC004536 TaxID=3364106 RepID=UPI003699ADD3